MVPQQWIANLCLDQVDPADRRRLDMVVYGASPTGVALCCDATVVAPLRRDGRPIGGAAREDGVALPRAAARKTRQYPELATRGPAQLRVLSCEIGGRWGPDCFCVLWAL